MLSNKINIFSIWLIILCLSVIFIILIGGYTRISDSGLSITEWLPVTGIFYPMSDASWEIEFNKYKMIDEFILVNSSMTLIEFKVIYFWEWFHRAFARLIGLIYIVPLVYLTISRRIPKGYNFNILLIGLLLAVQATVGWYMVKSGLTGRVDVSQYRLFLHLTIAFIILGLIFYSLLRFLIDYKTNSGLVKRSNLLLILFILIFIQIIYGAFVSGTDSGLLYNTWPFYNGNLVPGDMFIQKKYLLNFFENGDFIVFFHRTFAFMLLLIIIYLNFLIFNKDSKYETIVLIISFDLIFIIQGGIGVIMTFLNIPWYLALAHQGNSIILFLLSIYMWVLSRKSS
tara:strand:- start:1438 stop:2460 length:1023 start_codon:yes stop_codon:yes gene_type:complete